MSTITNQSNYSFAKRFKKFRCPHCEHSAPTLTKLKLHVATHINIKPFMCSICGWRANLRWYIQCHAKKRHSNMNFEVLQLSHEEAEQTINAYMKERGIDTKLNGGQDSKRRFQCSLCQFRSNHPKFIEQHIATNHPNKSYVKMIVNKKSQQQTNGHTQKSNGHDDKIYSKFMIKPPTKSDYQDEQNKYEIKSQALYNRSSLIQSDGTVILPDPSQIVYPNFSSHANFNPNRLFYCALCYRGYRWRYDVKRHHKTMHETPEDDMALGLSMSPKSVKRRNKEFNRNFRYLEYVPQLDGLISSSMSSVNHHLSVKQENDFDHEKILEGITDDDECEESQDNDLKLSIADARTVDVTEDEAAALLMIEPHKSDQSSILVNDHPDDSIIIFEDDRPNFNESKEKSPLPSTETSKISARTSSGFKPYRCPYCFYRTNWRTDSLRHIRARHKIEPTQDGYYEMTPEEAESTYAEYERTFGFIVAKKVLGRFTDFRHMEWKDLQKSIWDKIKDKQGYEQIIYDRLRPDNDSEIPKNQPDIPSKSTLPIVLNKTPIIKSKRMFTCMECAFRSHKLIELDKHLCTRFQNVYFFFLL
jgi:transcription elongation factor Elf1